MRQVSLFFVFTLVLFGYVRAEDNKTIVVMDNEVSNKIANPPPHHDSMANMKYACGVTMEQYIDTGEGNLTKEIKTRLAMVCCPGYKRDFRGICQPYCSGGCGDGFCESPEICSCQNNCAFNTVDRKCACFEAVCPGGCPANASCIADNSCDCNFAFVRKSNWTNQYTNSTAECIPYCYPFCTNKFMSSSPEHCICNYTQSPANGTTLNKDDPAANRSHEHLGHLFQSHGHPGFTAGLTGFALGALVGNMIGNFGKSKHKYGTGGSVYGMPGGYGGGYGNNPFGGGNYGHGYPGGYPNAGTNHGYNNPYGGNYGHSGGNYGHGMPPNYGQGVPPNYGQGIPPNTHYGQGVPNTNYGQGVPPNYGQGVPPNTNYGNNAQYPRQPAPSAPVQNTGIVHPQPGTGINHGTPGQPGWNVPGQNSGTDVQQKTSNTYSSVPGQAGKVAPSAPHLDSGTNAGTGQRTNYGWNTPSNTNTGSNTNYGWNVPSSTNTGSNTGTSQKGKTSGTSWPWSNSGGGSGGSGTGSSGRGKGSSGRKRGRKH